LDDAAVRRADLIAVDSIEQSKMEAGDLIQAFSSDTARWGTVKELGSILAGRATGRTGASQITLFKSNGIASWDVAVAARVYELALKRGMGQQFPLWEPRAAK
jgi:ornithine cyclodeaminase